MLTCWQLKTSWTDMVGFFRRKNTVWVQVHWSLVRTNGNGNWCSEEHVLTCQRILHLGLRHHRDPRCNTRWHVGTCFSYIPVGHHVWPFRRSARNLVATKLALHHGTVFGTRLLFAFLKNISTMQCKPNYQVSCAALELQIVNPCACRASYLKFDQL